MLAARQNTTNPNQDKNKSKTIEVAHAAAAAVVSSIIIAGLHFPRTPNGQRSTKPNRPKPEIACERASESDRGIDRFRSRSATSPTYSPQMRCFQSE